MSFEQYCERQKTKAKHLIDELNVDNARINYVSLLRIFEDLKKISTNKDNLKFKIEAVAIISYGFEKAAEMCGPSVKPPVYDFMGAIAYLRDAFNLTSQQQFIARGFPNELFNDLDIRHAEPSHYLFDMNVHYREQVKDLYAQAQAQAGAKYAIWQVIDVIRNVVRTTGHELNGELAIDMQTMAVINTHRLALMEQMNKMDPNMFPNFAVEKEQAAESYRYIMGCAIKKLTREGKAVDDSAVKALMPQYGICQYAIEHIYHNIQARSEPANSNGQLSPEGLVEQMEGLTLFGYQLFDQQNRSSRNTPSQKFPKPNTSHRP